MTHEPAYATYPVSNAQIYKGWDTVARHQPVFLRAHLTHLLFEQSYDPDTGITRWGVLGITPESQSILLSEHSTHEAAYNWANTNAQAWLT